MKRKLEGQIAIVTGASSGIGPGVLKNLHMREPLSL
jgi:NADP-dependent 3-hydroxy acid dehydrogenase YdfG